MSQYGVHKASITSTAAMPKKKRHSKTPPSVASKLAPAKKPAPRKVSEDDSVNKGFDVLNFRTVRAQNTKKKSLTLQQLRKKITDSCAECQEADADFYFVFYDPSLDSIQYIDKSWEPYQFANDYADKKLAFVPKDKLPEIPPFILERQTVRDTNGVSKKTPRCPNLPSRPTIFKLKETVVVSGKCSFTM